MLQDTLPTEPCGAVSGCRGSIPKNICLTCTAVIFLEGFWSGLCSDHHPRHRHIRHRHLCHILLPLLCTASNDEKSADMSFSVPQTAMWVRVHLISKIITSGSPKGRALPCEVKPRLHSYVGVTVRQYIYRAARYKYVQIDQFSRLGQTENKGSQKQGVSMASGCALKYRNLPATAGIIVSGCTTPPSAPIISTPAWHYHPFAHCWDSQHELLLLLKLRQKQILKTLGMLWSLNCILDVSYSLQKIWLV